MRAGSGDMLIFKTNILIQKPKRSFHMLTKIPTHAHIRIQHTLACVYSNRALAPFRFAYENSTLLRCLMRGKSRNTSHK